MPATLRLAPASDPKRSANSDRPIRIVLADDHVAVRRSLRLVLDRVADVEVVAEATDRAAALERVRYHHPDVLVLDPQLHDGASIETIRQLRASVPDTSLVVISMEMSAVFAAGVIEAGALGFVLKERSNSDLPPALRAAVRCEEWISPSIRQAAERLRRPSVLTPTE